VLKEPVPLLERYETPAKALNNIDSWPDEIDGIGSKDETTSISSLKKGLENFF